MFGAQPQVFRDGDISGASQGAGVRLRWRAIAPVAGLARFDADNGAFGFAKVGRH
jgi:hypothetical protein